MKRLLAALLAVVMLVVLLPEGASLAQAVEATSTDWEHLRFDDRVDVTGKHVVITDAGTPTSYQVGYGVAENAVPDTAVLTLEGNTLMATGIGTATITVDGAPMTVTVEAAPLSLLLVIGQSNARGSEGDANQSIVCPDGMVYSTFGDDRGADNAIMTEENAARFAASALTGPYSTINVEGTTENLSAHPLNALTEAGAGKIGFDSGLAYEWVKQTGDKVWVVNAAHGGTGIASWQEGAIQFVECEKLFRACQETIRKEIAAGHYTLAYMGYFWCQGCGDSGKTAQQYVEQYRMMHDSLQKKLTFDHDSDPATPDSGLTFAGIIPVRAGGETTRYRDGVYAAENPYAYHESYEDIRMTGPRVAQYWMGNNPEWADIWVVCTISEDWVWMPDGTNGVEAYFRAYYPDGRVDYPVQVAQKEAWYTPTTPAAVHDSIHYNQIGYNELGRESARNTLILLGAVEAPATTPEVTFLGWDGFTEVTEMFASTTGKSTTLVVPSVSPVWMAKEVTYTMTEGLSYTYYDLTARSEDVGGTLTANGAVGMVEILGHIWSEWVAVQLPTPEGPGVMERTCAACGNVESKTVDGVWQKNKLAEHLTALPETVCGGLNLWPLLEKDPYYFSSGVSWVIHSENLTSVTIPVQPGDKIYSSSFDAWAVNGVSSGIRVTFFDAYGVAKTYGTAECHNEFKENGGYLIAPEGAIAINVPMYTNSRVQELYILNREHSMDAGVCLACGAGTHEHSWSAWETVKLPTPTAPGEKQRVCDICGESESGLAEGVWTKYALDAHLLELPENLCCGINLWAVLPHETVHFTSGQVWGNTTYPVSSITIPLEAGDRIYATSFLAVGENGGTVNGIRLTFFDAEGVALSPGPEGVYKEWLKQGYVEAPAGTVAVNIPMWGDESSYEAYILNRDHDYEDGVCRGCGDVNLSLMKPLTFVGDSTWGVAGDTVTVTLSAGGDVVKGLALSQFAYDRDSLELLSAQWLVEGIVSGWDAGKQAAVIAFGENTTLEGPVFSLTFRIREGAAIGDQTVSCQATVKILSGGEELQRPAEVIAGVVDVQMAGDINGDDRLDSEDAVALLFHVLLPEEYPILQRADINGDGKVTTDDAIYLLYHTLIPEQYPVSR